jgi:hypothetical protein
MAEIQNLFRQWVREQKPILNSIDTDEFLLRFLRVTDFNLTRAKEWLINFWKYHTENPQWFTDRDLLKNPLMLGIAETGYCLQLPKETKDQQLVFLMRIGHFDSKKYTLDDATKYALAVTDILNRQPAAQLYGFIIILDFTEVTLHHVRDFTPDHTKRYVDCWEKMFPVKLCQIHFYNYPTVFDPVLHLIRMFLSKELKEKIHFHSKSYESLHKYVDPELLPSEYGGKLGPIEGEINQKFVQWVRKDNDYMVQMDRYGVDLKQVPKLLKRLT